MEDKEEKAEAVEVKAEKREQLPLFSAAEIQAILPPVSEAIASGAADDAGFPKDANGEEFNAEIHVTDAEGNPVLTKDGKLRRKAGRKGRAAAKAKPGEKAEAAEAVDVRALVPNYNGIVFTRSMEAVLVQFFGPDWAFQKVGDYSEADNLAAALQRVMDKRGLKEIPAELELMLILMAYAGPRMTRPRFREKASGWLDSLKGAFYWLRGRWPFRRGGAVSEGPSMMDRQRQAEKDAAERQRDAA